MNFTSEGRDIVMSDADYLTGKLLLAMPTMEDPRFDRAVIYLCAHSAEGAMGLVINQRNEGISFAGLLEQLNIETSQPAAEIPVNTGGPVEGGRGFVLHSADYVQESTLIVSETMALTATVDILQAIAEGRGPRDSLMALGYAGWGAGQLESEIQANEWLTAEADSELVFYTENMLKWPRAMAKLGIELSMLSLNAGHA